MQKKQKVNRKYAELIRIDGEYFLASLDHNSDNSLKVKEFILNIQDIK